MKKTMGLNFVGELVWKCDRENDVSGRSKQLIAIKVLVKHVCYMYIKHGCLNAWTTNCAAF